MTTIVNISKKALVAQGYRDLEHWLEDDTHVYIGRSMGWVAGATKSEFANPYSVKEFGRDGCIAAYKTWLLEQPDLRVKLESLRGKVLGCWCHPEACHGDVIVELLDMTAKGCELPPRQFEMFWKRPSPFNQWYECVFEAAPLYGDDQKTKQLFESSEQWMMYNKALLFGDTAIAKKILATPSAKAAKAYGRKVKGFSDKVWGQECFKIVVHGNFLKFSLVPGLLDVLMETGTRTLVEASPVDRIWGVGLAANHKYACIPEKWKGRNLLGKALTGVREELRALIESAH